MRFSIRDILWLTILVAVAVTWWLEHRASVRMQAQLRQQARQVRRELFNVHRARAQANIAAVHEWVRVLTEQVRAAELEAALSGQEKLANP